MSSELVVLRGRVYVVEFEYEPATGDGVEEEYFPESYTIVNIFSYVPFRGARGNNLVDKFSSGEVIEAIKRVGSSL